MLDQNIFCLFFILYARWETHVQKIWSQSNHKHIISLFNSSIVEFFWCVMQIFLLPTHSNGNMLPGKFFVVPVCCVFVLFFTSKLKHMGLNPNWQNFLITPWRVNIYTENDKQACFDRFVISNFSTCRWSSETGETLNTWHVKLWPIFLREILKALVRHFPQKIIFSRFATLRLLDRTLFSSVKSVGE